MNRLLGVVLMVALLYGAVLASDPAARSPANQQEIGTRLGFYGVLTVGVGVLIVSGGIDLSIGSVVALGAVGFGLLLQRQVPPPLALLIVMAGGALIGLVHGLLVTLLRLQPFLVTLCGLFIYRGLARWASPFSVDLPPRETPPEFQASVKSFEHLLVGYWYGVPAQLFLLLGVALLLGLFLHGTKYGRYLYAIGHNEEAARYAGIATARYKVLAYVICSTLAGLGSVLFILEAGSANATNAGTFYELFAITGAVVGGCSLRGGEGTAPGMVLGAAVLPLLRKLCQFYRASNEIEFAVIGAALLLGTIADELLRRRAERRG
jgi:ribose transport system permease protein